MKKSLAITFMTMAMAGGLMASGAQDGTTYSSIDRESVESVASEIIKVIPSGDVLGIFSDNDDDGLYSEAEPFLSGETARSEMPASVNAYIGETIFNNPDDLIETINDELSSVLVAGQTEESHMILGNYQMTAKLNKAEGFPTYVTYTRELLETATIGKVEISASEDILAVFSDNDDDGLYDETLPFLTGEESRNNMSKASADFVYAIISEDTDDIMELIRDELKAPLEKGIVERSEMVLGNYRFTSTVEAPQTYKFSSEEIFYEPMATLTITASDDILSIFSDNDDHGLYGEALPYLTGMASAESIPVAVANYISEVLSEDCDDVMDYIRDELNDALESGESDSVSMQLGDNIFTVSTDFAG